MEITIKRVILTLMIFFMSNISIPSMSENVSIMELPKTANFMISYEKLRTFEGNYVNHPSDKGRETYAGISREYNPDWKGWKYVDQAKRDSLKIRKRPLKWNTRLDGMVEHYAINFYVDIWVAEKWYMMEDQQLADYLFNLRANGVVGGIRLLQKSLVDMKALEKRGNRIYRDSIDVTDKMDSCVVAAVNSVNKYVLLKDLSKRRMKFYVGIVKRQFNSKVYTSEVDQMQFLEHWLERAIDL